jgi:transposase
MLRGYSGYCQTDAFSGYDALESAGSGIRLVGCFAHVRRNFLKVIEARGKSKTPKTGSADIALDYIRQLYTIERAVRAMGLAPDQLRVLRQARAGPIVENFKTWLLKRVSQTPPQGLSGKALNYALANWPRLIRYLDDGHITPDNNAAENAIRPFVVGRKNWLFAGHPNGAHAAATLYSLIETAKGCGVEPYRYLRFLFERLPYSRNDEELKALLPPHLASDQSMRAVVNG